MTGDPAATVDAAPPRCAADYFDGLQARAQPVTLMVRERLLHIDGDAVALRVPVRRVNWPERQRHGARQAYLPGKGMLSCTDAAAWDAWAAASGVRERLLVRWMQSWRGVLLAFLLLLGALVGAFRWGLPWAAQALVALTPQAVERQLGTLVLDGFEREWLKPSQLPPAQQAAPRTRFEQALQRLPAAPPPSRWTLHVRATPPRGGLGANAFALPGGDIVVAVGRRPFVAAGGGAGAARAGRVNARVRVRGRPSRRPADARQRHRTGRVRRAVRAHGGAARQRRQLRRAADRPVVAPARCATRATDDRG